MTYTVAVYECQYCGNEVTQAQMKHQCDVENDYECPWCNMRTPEQFDHERKAKYVTLAAYDTWRSYGGAEEGGWYYDEGKVHPETIRAFEAGDFTQIAVYRETLQRRFNGKAYIRTYVERMAPRSFPEARPRYS